MTWIDSWRREREKHASQHEETRAEAARRVQVLRATEDLETCLAESPIRTGRAERRHSYNPPHYEWLDDSKKKLRADLCTLLDTHATTVVFTQLQKDLQYRLDGRRGGRRSTPSRRTRRRARWRH